MDTSAKTILLVEDEAIIALSEEKDLKDAGFNVIVAHSGEEAVMKVEARPGMIDLILMDINLGPGIDGAEAAQIILRSNDIPVIFLSSHIEPEIVDKVEKIASYGYVVKGSSETVLLASIRMAFRLYEANRNSRMNEAALKESEEKYRQLFENMTAGFALNEIIYDDYGAPCDYRNVEVNPAFEKITGFSASQVKNIRAKEFSPGANINWLKAYLKDSPSGKPVVFENYFPAIDKYLEVLVYSPRKHYTASILYDVTERKKAEKKLTYSFNLLSYFIKHARSAIAIHDRDMKYLYVSDEYLRQYNVRETNIIGRHHYEVFPALPEKWKKVHQMALNGIISSAEMDPYLKEDGTMEWTNWDCRPWYEADGNIGGIIINTEVITEKVRALDKLLKLDKIFENATWGLTACGKDFKTLEMINPEFARMHGYSPEEMSGFRVEDLFPQEEKEKHEEYFRITNEKGYHQFETIHLRKDGSRFPVLAEITSIKDQEGKVLFHAANIIDRTEIEKKEEVIKASLQEKELLLKEIHHRVKNNLQIISSLLSLQSDRAAQSSYEEAFRESQNRIKSISLVHEKLYRSANLSKIDISDYIRTLIIFLKKAYAVDNSRVEVRGECDSVNMPIDAAIPCGLILNELVSNAFKYAFPNAENGLLTYSVKDRIDQIEIRIKDNGPGLPAGTDLKNGGTLGTLIISSLVAQLSGNSEIKTGAGVEYILTIPKIWEKKPPRGL